MRSYLAIGLLCVVGVAAGQNTMFLRNSPIAYLDPDDRQILRDTINDALDSPDGTVIDWANPESGSSGRVTVLDTHEAYGTTCRHLRTRSQARGRESEGVYRLCKSEDGTWRFASADTAVAEGNAAAPLPAD